MKIKSTFQLALLAILISLAVNLPGQIPAPPQSEPIALVNGVIHPVTGPVVEKGSMLFIDGTIIEVGANINIPADAKIINLQGDHVYPAFIEAYSVLGLTEIGAVSATRDYSETGEINPNVRAEVAVNPESELFPVARANGIGLAATVPSGGIISGKSALLRLDGWTWEEMTLKAPLSLVLNWPEMRVYPNRQVRQSPEEQRKRIKERLEVLEKAFQDAKAYKTARTESKSKAGFFHRHDVRWEAMIPVLQRELPVWIEASSLQQIEAAINWADREHVQMVLVGGTDAWETADLLKRKNIPVIVTSVFRLPSRRDADFDEAFTLPARLYQAGIKFCIATGSASNTRNLPYHAAKAAAYGLPKDEALKAITIYPAEIMGVADRVGSLEKGKDATIMVTTGDPLEITSQVKSLYIQGREIDLNNKHKRLYDKYRERYRQLDAEIK